MRSSSITNSSNAQRPTPPRILIVDDKEADARELGNTMVRRGFDLEVVQNSSTALDLAKQWKPDVAILDVNMPGMTGLALCQQLRECADDPIVIFVTADDSNEMRRQCLEAGDDYITKPYDGENLLLRVQNKLRRIDPYRKAAPKGSGKTSRTNEDGKSARRPNHPFTRTEMRLLKALIAGKGETVPRDKLLEAVWDDASAVYDNTLDMNIRRLRMKIEPDPSNPRIILTVRKVGYRLNLAEWRRLRND